MYINQTNRKISQTSLFTLVCQGLFTSIFISLIGVFFISMYVFFTESVLDEGKLKIIFIVIMLTSIFIATLLTGYNMKAKGLLTGIIIGGLYAGIALLFSEFVISNAGNGIMSLTKVLICMGAGGLGGVIGVNL